MDRGLPLELVRTTEAAALSCSKWFGRGNPFEAVDAACNSIKQRLNFLNIKGTIVAGIDTRRIPETEFIKPLVTGSQIGTGEGMELDIVLNPVDCAENLAKGKINAISIICTAPKGGMMHVPNVYMDKLAVGPQLKGKVSLDQSKEEMFQIIADVLGKEVEEITVCILERERNQKLIDEIRKLGPRIRLFQDGDIVGAMATHPWSNSDMDILLGSGKSYQGLMAAVGMKCMDGDFQGKFLAFNDEDKKLIKQHNVDINKIYGLDDLAPGQKLNFVATGITPGPFLKGIRYNRYGAKTRSIVARSKSGTIRYIDTYHKC